MGREDTASSTARCPVASEPLVQLVLALRISACPLEREGHRGSSRSLVLRRRSCCFAPNNGAPATRLWVLVRALLPNPSLERDLHRHGTLAASPCCLSSASRPGHHAASGPSAQTLGGNVDISLDDVQFKLLPFGSLLLLAVLALLWFYRRQLQRRGLATILLSGVAGGGLLVALLYGLRLIPWVISCLDCFASSPWYSLILTFLQGWGFVSGVALALWYFRRSQQVGDQNAA